MNQGITISAPVLAIIICVVGLSIPVIVAIIQKKSKYVSKDIFDLSLGYIKESLTDIKKSMESMNKKMDRHIQTSHVSLCEFEEDEK